MNDKFQMLRDFQNEYAKPDKTLEEFAYELIEKNKELKKKFLEAVDNYEQVNFKNIQAIEFVKTEHNTYPSAEKWRQALINILEGDN